MGMHRFAIALLFAFSTTVSAATFSVTSGADSGAGTLRQAILDANALPGRDTINVLVNVLVSSSSLPPITDPVDIDGTTTGISRAQVESAHVEFTLLQFAAGSSTSTARDLRLVLGRLVQIDVGVTGVTVANTFFSNGTVRIDGDGNTLGGTSAADANTRVGVVQLNVGGNSNQILRSNFGTVFVSGDHNQIGTNDAGNSFGPVSIFGGEGNILEGNTITAPSSAGIHVNQISGDPTIIRANTIQNAIIGIDLRAVGTIVTENTIRNNATGVRVLDDPGVGPLLPFTGVAITGNSFSGNGIPIDLNGDGPTPNDPAPDADTGPNNFQNFPVLTSAVLTGGALTVNGTLTSAPLTPYQIELFSNDAADPEARTFLEAFTVTTDAAGNASFTRTMTANLPDADEVITATATNRSLVSVPGNGANETSEVSAPVAIAAPGVIGFDPVFYVVDETDGTVTIIVTRTGGSEGTVTVDYATADGTATAPADYTSVSGTLTFGDGVTQQSFTVPIAADSVAEQDETFTITLSNVTGGATLGPATAVVTIAGDVSGIPTLSTWGLLAMVMAMATVALWRR
jgi:hypothetical protein